MGSEELRYLQQFPTVDRVERGQVLRQRALVLAGAMGAKQGPEEADHAERLGPEEHPPARQAAPSKGSVTGVAMSSGRPGTAARDAIHGSPRRSGPKSVWTEVGVSVRR